MLTKFYFSTVPSRELVFTWGKKKKKNTDSGTLGLES